MSEELRHVKCESVYEQLGPWRHSLTIAGNILKYSIQLAFANLLYDPP